MTPYGWPEWADDGLRSNPLDEQRITDRLKPAMCSVLVSSDKDTGTTAALRVPVGVMPASIIPRARSCVNAISVPEKSFSLLGIQQVPGPTNPPPSARQAWSGSALNIVPAL